MSIRIISSGSMWMGLYYRSDEKKHDKDPNPERYMMSPPFKNLRQAKDWWYPLFPNKKLFSLKKAVLAWAKEHRGNARLSSAFLLEVPWTILNELDSISKFRYQNGEIVDFDFLRKDQDIFIIG